jgi:antibiotic biosynthesis monooxygenase (ABM) superfamily enzyme
MPMSAATAVTIFHPTSDTGAFTSWAAELEATARGAGEFRVSMLGEQRLEWAVAVTFADDDALQGWLDSAARARLLRDAQSRGILRASSDLVIGEDAGVPSGVGLFRHAVAPGRSDDYAAAEVRLAEVSGAFPGFEGMCAFAPDAGGDSMSVLRFRTERQLANWLSSQQRTEALSSLMPSLTRKFSVVASTTAFGTTVRTENGRTAITPRWKTAMLILLVLYPTVMSLSRFVGPSLYRLGAPEFLVLWLLEVGSVAVLQWLLMPAAGRRFRRWLDPVDGAGVRISVLGAAAVAVGYAAALTLFGTVHWLQFWDYASR